MTLVKYHATFAEEFQPKPAEKRAPQQGRRTAEGILTVLYLTDDFVEADYLALQLRNIAPKMAVDVRPISAFDKLRSGSYDVALVDCCGSPAFRTSVIEYLRDDVRNVTVIAILREGWNESETSILMAEADAHIIKCRNLANVLPMVINDGLRCHESRMNRRMLSRQREIQVNGSQSSAQGMAELPAPAAVVSSNPRHLVLNKRTSRRSQVLLSGRLEWAGRCNSAVVHDLSESGLFLETSAPPPDGAKVVIYLDTGNSKLTLSAVVVHHGWFMSDFQNFYGFGAQLTNVDNETLQRLRALLSGKHDPPTPKIILTP